MNYDHNLGHLFDFKRDDLEANQAGQLSAAQLQRFAANNRGCLIWGWGVTLIFAALTIFAYFTQNNPPNDLPITLLIITVICAVGMLATWWVGPDIFHLNQISGEGNLTEDRTDGSLRYRLNVKGYVFALTAEQYNQIEDGINYTIYYATRETNPDKQKTAYKIIQSIEKS